MLTLGGDDTEDATEPRVVWSLGSNAWNAGLAGSPGGGGGRCGVRQGYLNGVRPYGYGGLVMPVAAMAAAVMDACRVVSMSGRCGQTRTGGD